MPEDPRVPPADDANHSLARLGPEAILALLGALREGVIAVDVDLRVVAMNRAATELLGRDLAAMEGQPVCDLFGVHPCPSDALTDSLQHGQPVTDFQTSLRLADDGLAQVLIRSVPLQQRDGSPAGVGLVLGDVTEVTALRKQMSERHRLGNIIGKNPRMQQLYRLIEDVADSEATVLIRGESGTGKELVARAIHAGSRRAGGPFVHVNCSALSEALLESELFGHVKGAFTGAVSERRGRFEQAHGGTIFLDEIGDVSPVVQVKLLRVLQERVVERVGENRPRSVDVRVVSATNRDLEHLLAGGRMREDFYYRIKVVSLQVPPLRERRDDIPLLVAHILTRLRGRRIAVPVPVQEVSPEAMARLLRHRWPGNVRELQHALEHAQVLSRGQTLQPNHLPPEVAQAAESSLLAVPRHSLEERDLIRAELERNGWNRSRTARKLGIDRTTLWRKIREYDLEPGD